MDVAQNLQGLSYEVCSINIATIFRTQIIYSGYWDMRHYIPAACCYVTRIYEIRLWKNILTFCGYVLCSFFNIQERQTSGLQNTRDFNRMVKIIHYKSSCL